MTNPTPDQPPAAQPPLLAAAFALELDRDASAGESAEYRRGMTRAVELLRTLNQDEPAVPVPSVDRAALRQRIADVLAAVDGWVFAPGFKDGSPTYQGFLRQADAVLDAVLPVPADRAAVLLWAADRIDNEELPDDYIDMYSRTTTSTARLLRRLAAEAQPAECRASQSGACLAESQSETACATEDGECVYGGQPAAEAQPATPDTETPTLTEARAAFMQIGRTPSLEGLRAELRIEGQEPLIGRYCGASMGRLHDVPGHEHLLAVDPRLIFEYADQPAAPGAAATPETDTPAETVHGCPRPGSSRTPCCDRLPWELPLTDRISSEAPITCPGRPS
ncbi:hypothetical protein [Streptomyces fumanus]|uniref:hypothetical protein n=1 Tax=Streptomyces fumanus TaxID=67302 RepID=UPI0033FECDA4